MLGDEGNDIGDVDLIDPELGVDDGGRLLVGENLEARRRQKEVDRRQGDAEVAVVVDYCMERAKQGGKLSQIDLIPIKEVFSRLLGGEDDDRMAA